MLELQNISKAYGDRTVLSDISFSIEKGEIVSILGPSGCGKTTLLNLVLGLVTATDGRILFDGVDLTHVPMEKRGFNIVFQDYALFPNLNAYENIVYGLRNRPDVSTRSEVDDLIDLLGLRRHLEQRIDELSGGQKQRVGIARALANDPKVLLSDEATSALDPETTTATLALLQRINRELGVTIVMITHEMNVVKQICERVVVMNQGEIVESGDVLDIFSRPQSETTRALIGNVMARDLPESVIRVFRNARENAEEGKSVHLLRLAFVGSEVTKPVISECSQRFHVNLSILRGTVDDLHGRTLGTLTVLVETPIADYIRVIEFIRSRGVIVEELNDVL